MILSDNSIKEKLKKGDIYIEPFSQKNLQPASYDLHLDKNILEFKNPYCIKTLSNKYFGDMQVKESQMF